MATGPWYSQLPTTPSSRSIFPANLADRLQPGARQVSLPKVLAIRREPQSNGYYLKITSQEAARVVNVQDFQWPDDAPDRTSDSGHGVVQLHPVHDAAATRYKFRLGDKASGQAVWPIIEQHSAIKAAQCMTARTVPRPDCRHHREQLAAVQRHRQPVGRPHGGRRRQFPASAATSTRAPAPRRSSSWRSATSPTWSTRTRSASSTAIRKSSS